MRIDKLPAGVRVYSLPATRLAEELGKRMVMNIVMVGFFGAVTNLLNPDALRNAIADSVPEAFRELNLKAFDKGFEYGMNHLTGKVENEEQPIEVSTPRAVNVRPNDRKPAIAIGRLLLLEDRSTASILRVSLKCPERQGKTFRLNNHVTLIRTVDVGNCNQHQRDQKAQHDDLQHMKAEVRHAKEARRSHRDNSPGDQYCSAEFPAALPCFASSECGDIR